MATPQLYTRHHLVCIHRTAFHSTSVHEASAACLHRCASPCTHPASLACLRRPLLLAVAAAACACQYPVPSMNPFMYVLLSLYCFSMMRTRSPMLTSPMALPDARSRTGRWRKLRSAHTHTHTHTHGAHTAQPHSNTQSSSSENEQRSAHGRGTQQGAGCDGACGFSDLCLVMSSRQPMAWSSSYANTGDSVMNSLTDALVGCCPSLILSM